MSVSLSLIDELTMKQPLKFQINNMSTAFLKGRIGLSKDNVFVNEVLLNNNEGIFYLKSDFFKDDKSVNDFVATLGLWEGYNLVINQTPTNYEIMFQKSKEGVKN
jgi:hypothetical protein